MKTGVFFAVGVAVGAVFSWSLGYLHPRTVANRQALEYMNRAEPEFVGRTILALGTIPLIESGATNLAMERLSDAVPDYYRTYARNPGTNEYRKRARAVIEARAATNQILASRIEHKMTNEPLGEFERIWIEEWKDYVYVRTATNSPRAAGSVQ